MYLMLYSKVTKSETNQYFTRDR